MFTCTGHFLLTCVKHSLQEPFLPQVWSPDLYLHQLGDRGGRHHNPGICRQRRDLFFLTPGEVRAIQLDLELSLFQGKRPRSPILIVVLAIRRPTMSIYFIQISTFPLDQALAHTKNNSNSKIYS
jgi:hypothetical protein